MNVCGMCARVAMVLTVVVCASGTAAGQETPFEPVSGQAGKDVVWVPTPPELVEKMLDLGKITAQDIVMDLGSGDGRNIIGAAKRGATAIGVEYNPDMVRLSNRLAKEAGVSGKATFIEGDMYVADISKATALVLFLLPSNMLILRDKFFALQPGSRIVSNTFTIQDWNADEQITIDNCSAWCTALLYIVPAKIGGTWKTPEGDLTLVQDFQMLTGALVRPGGAEITVTGKLRGNEITLVTDGQEMKGTVRGATITGTRAKGGAWSASKVN